MDIINNATAKSVFTEANTASFPVATMEAMVRVTNWSKSNVDTAIQKIFFSTYGVSTMDEVVLKFSAVDRAALLTFIMNRSSGATDQMHELIPRAWAAKAIPVCVNDMITITNGDTRTDFIETVVPVPQASRLGLAHIVNFTSCVLMIDQGHIKTQTNTKPWMVLFQGTRVTPAKIGKFVEAVENLWQTNPTFEPERKGEKTFRGFALSSLLSRFFSVITISEYSALHTLLTMDVMNLFVPNGRTMTDKLRMVPDNNGKLVEIVPLSTVRKINTTSPGEWGTFATQLKAAKGYHPTILAGPIGLSLKWMPVDHPTIEAVRDSYTTATNLRGGNDSYWTRILSCQGLSVASQTINDMRLLTALALTYLRLPNSNGKNVQLMCGSGEVNIIDESLRQHGIDTTTRVSYLLEKKAVTNFRGVVAKRVSSASKVSDFLIAIAEFSIPSVPKNGRVSDTYDEVTRSYFSTVAHPEFAIFMPVLSPKLFEDSKKVVTYRMPFDFKAVCTTNTQIVSQELFPNKKTYGKWADFLTDCMIGAKFSTYQFTDPLQIRSVNCDLLNILRFPRSTVIVRVDVGGGCYFADADTKDVYDDGYSEENEEDEYEQDERGNDGDVDPDGTASQSAVNDMFANAGELDQT